MPETASEEAPVSVVYKKIHSSIRLFGITLTILIKDVGHPLRIFLPGGVKTLFRSWGKGV